MRDHLAHLLRPRGRLRLMVGVRGRLRSCSVSASGGLGLLSAHVAGRQGRDIGEIQWRYVGDRWEI